MPQIIPLLTVTLFCTWYEESTPRAWKCIGTLHVQEWIMFGDCLDVYNKKTQIGCLNGK